MKNTKILAITLMLASTLAIAACENTWHGAGEDVEQAGEAMQMQSDGNNY